MANANRLSLGEVIAGRYISKTGITFGDGTVQDTASATGLGTSTRWTPAFAATGLTYTGTGVNHPAYNSYYAQVGKVISFNIKIEMSTVTNFGTGQFTTELPFMPLTGTINHFPAWVWVNPAEPVDELNGHIVMECDHLPNTKTLDLHWLKETTASPKPVIESILSQGNPVTLITSSIISINGTYIAN